MPSQKSTIDCYGKNKMLDRNMLRIKRVENYPESCLLRFSMMLRIDIYMTNSILRKPKYHQILPRRALTSEKKAI